MRIIFRDYKTEEESQELYHILEVEAKEHFPENTWDIGNGTAYDPKKDYVDRYCAFYVSDKDYFNDIEKAKNDMYESISKEIPENALAVAYMKDFVSEVQENISFVPKVSID